MPYTHPTLASALPSCDRCSPGCAPISCSPASLAGTLDGLRDVVAKALIATGETLPSLARNKALGDNSDDLVYTPVVPCRILDTRNAGGPLLAGVTRTFIGYNATSFVVQGGVASNCGVPDGVAALSLNIAAVQPADAGFIRLWPDDAPMPFASMLNYAAGAFATATGTIVPVNSGNNNQFDAWSPAQVDFVADVVGYVRRARNYGGTHVITGITATDGGGYQNTASGNVSTVSGGQNNTASGAFSTVAGGRLTAPVVMIASPQARSPTPQTTVVLFGATLPIREY